MPWQKRETVVDVGSLMYFILLKPKANAARDGRVVSVTREKPLV